ncbi:hypothetical protein C8J57DRAFT_523081 [Mycena rebaudengoi]|nr:hypothetical protein C8J57DRAFT_523081 [Mycena rebaudengoi]
MGLRRPPPPSPRPFPVAPAQVPPQVQAETQTQGQVPALTITIPPQAHPHLEAERTPGSRGPRDSVVLPPSPTGVPINFSRPMSMSLSSSRRIAASRRTSISTPPSRPPPRTPIPCDVTASRYLSGEFAFATDYAAYAPLLLSPPLPSACASSAGLNPAEQYAPPCEPEEYTSSHPHPLLSPARTRSASSTPPPPLSALFSPRRAPRRACRLMCVPTTTRSGPQMCMTMLRTATCPSRPSSSRCPRPPPNPRPGRSPRRARPRPLFSTTRCTPQTHWTSWSTRLGPSTSTSTGTGTTRAATMQRATGSRARVTGTPGGIRAQRPPPAPHSHPRSNSSSSSTLSSVHSAHAVHSPKLGGFAIARRYFPLSTSPKSSFKAKASASSTNASPTSGRKSLNLRLGGGKKITTADVLVVGCPPATPSLLGGMVDVFSAPSLSPSIKSRSTSKSKDKKPKSRLPPMPIGATSSPVYPARVRRPDSAASSASWNYSPSVHNDSASECGSACSSESGGMRRKPISVEMFLR